jgi:hypothetical protein
MGPRQMAKHTRRQKGIESIGHEFDSALGCEVIKANTISEAEFVSNLRRLERYYLEKLEGYPKLALSIRRQIAVQLLDQSILRGASFSVCRERMKASSELGFRDLGQKATYHVLYAKVAFARGHKRVANRITSEIIDELERSLKKNKSLLSEQCLAFARRFMDFMKRTECLAGGPGAGEAQ